MQGSDAPASKWTAYREWNRALAEVVYSPEAAGRPAYLDLEDSVLEQVSERAGRPGAGRDELAGAVRATLGPPARQQIFAAHRAQLRAWRTASGRPPPVIALLSVLCLAAEDMRDGEGMSANNYYDRLMPLLKVSEENKARVVSAYRTCSHELWNGLNSWLEDLQGERGLPTAYSFSHEHIGPPISQALIRGFERDKLTELFEELGLSRRARMSPPDMRDVLEQWMGRTPSPASHGLRTLWRSESARERITEVACELLATWEPHRDEAIAGRRASRTTRSGSGARPVQLIAELASFPMPSLQLGALGSGVPERGDLSLDIAQDTVSQTTLSTVELPGDRWALADPAQLDPESLLSAHLRLTTSSSTVFERRPRRLVPFTRDDLLQAFIESERMSLGGTGLLLCHQDLAEPVERALKATGRPGFQRWTDPPAGAPPQWVLFSDVQILAPLPSTDPKTGRDWPDDLNALQPLGTSQVLLEGGLQLPGRVRRWSSLAAPELRIATTDAQRLDVVIRQVRTFAEDLDQLQQTLTGPVALLDLNVLGLPDGDYEIRVAAGAAGRATPPPLDVARLRLRSADTPNPAALIPADGAELPVAPPRARSDILEAHSANVSEGRQYQAPAIPHWWKNRQEAPASLGTAQTSRIVVASTRTASCVHNGAHYMELPTFYGHAAGGSVEGLCRDCGLVKRYPARYRRAHSARGGRRAASTPPRLDVSTMLSVQHQLIGPDTVLDALSHDRRGSASGLERLAVQVDASPLFADRLLRGLECLSHLVLHREARTRVARGWEMWPATLAQTSRDSFVLTGVRSRRLLATLHSTADAHGAVIEHQSQEAAPARFRVRGISTETAVQMAEQVSAEAGTTFQVFEHAPQQLAAALRPLSTLVAELPKLPMLGFRRCRRWDSDIAQWIPAPDASTPGVYQLTGATTTYCLRDENDVAEGTMRRGDARIVKHAAAKSANAPLLGYDQSTATLYLPLGGDLPDPYAQVAVSCSGLLPNQDTAQRITRYRDVPPDIACILANLLAR